jgi:hypothetical protein
LVDYVATRYPDISKIFSHGIVVTYVKPPRPAVGAGLDPHHFKRDEYREEVKMILKREEEFKFNKKLAYGVLWKHCSLALQNSIRGIAEFERISSEEDVVTLWIEVKRLCTVGVVVNADPEKVQRDADFRFMKVHQFYNESVPAFYDRYLQEVNAWIQAGNAFVDAELIMEGGDAGDAIDEDNPRVRATRERIKIKSDKKMAMNFLTKLDRNRFMSMSDELANDLAKGKNNYPNTAAEAMQLAQTYRSDGRMIGDMVSGGKDTEESAYVTQEYKYKNKNKNRGYKRKSDTESDDPEKVRDYSSVECYLCKQRGHFRNKCPMLAEAEKYLKAKKLKSENETKQATVTKTDKNKNDKSGDVAFMVHDVAFANKKSLLDEYDILCDNQATINIFKNKDMLVNVTRASESISVGGVGGILEVDQIGELPGFGKVYYNPDCIANILCFPRPRKEKYD